MITSFKNRKSFDRICKSNHLQLDHNANKDTLYLLRAIFEEREYADYFPFYENATILDIGAHYGYFSLFASRNSGSECRIIAIEPDAGNYSMLQKNLLDCSVKNVEILNLAVSDQSGEVRLFTGNSVNHSLVKDYALNESDAASIVVKSMSLEQLINEKKLDKVDFLKLDCEGAEYAILLNSSDSVFASIQTISMEFHDLKDQKFTGNVLVKRLRELKYEIVKFTYEKTSRGLNFGKIIATRY